MTDPDRLTACEACGRPLSVTPGRGRPRRYCDATCRSAARRRRERDGYDPATFVKQTLTTARRQDYVDGMGTAADPAGPTASRMSAVAARLTAELTRTGAGSPLTAVASARELSVLAGEALQETVDRARAAGHSWKEIGDVLETTRQAAFQRFGRPMDPRTGEPMTKVVLPGAAERAVAIFTDIAAGRWLGNDGRPDRPLRGHGRSGCDSARREHGRGSAAELRSRRGKRARDLRRRRQGRRPFHPPGRTARSRPGS
jgi:hypothetical protein